MKSKLFSFTSGGAAYNLIVGFAPTRVEVVNTTKYATDASVIESKWDSSMASGYSYNLVNEADAAIASISTSNGFTPYGASNFATNQYTITGISAAAQAVVTATNTASVGDYVYITGVVGMTEINDAHYKVVAATSSTFTIDVDSSGFTAYSSGGIAKNVSETQVDNGGAGITLGTAVVGADSDVMKVYCFLDDQGVVDLGDIG
jgi:hypothetical protein